MPFYRKKPVVIEARRYTGENRDEITRWCPEAVVIQSPHLESATELVIKTLEGTMFVSPGDYVIKGVSGEFYPIKPDIFIQTYEEVEEADANRS